MLLSGSTILVTGGTSGIGRALAQEFDRLGHTVIICGRREARLDQVRQASPRIITRRCDLASAEGRAALVDWVLDAHPEINVLVNNAGLQLLLDATRPVDLTRVHAELETNLVAPLHLTSLLAPHLAGRRGATVVNISSGLAFAPVSGIALYCATKAAVHSLTQSLRHQYRSLGIRVIEIAPPAVDTELGADRRSDPSRTHGGIPVSEFVEGAMAGLAAGQDEILVGHAARIHASPAQMYALMNP